MSVIDTLEQEGRVINEEIEAQRLSDERRFSPPAGTCQWGCDGSGWLELSGDIEPAEPMEIYHNGMWWTPCECNMASLWWAGHCWKWPRRYLAGYIGPRITPPAIRQTIQLHSVKGALDGAAEAVNQLPLEDRAGWVDYLLESLEAGAQTGEYEAMLKAVQVDIAQRLEHSRW